MWVRKGKFDSDLKSFIFKVSQDHEAWVGSHILQQQPVHGREGEAITDFFASQDPKWQQIAGPTAFE